MRLLALLLLTSTLAASPSLAQVAEPSPRAQDAFDVMNLLTKAGLHNLDDESWNAYGQLTWISSLKAPFQAPYTNLNGSNMSLSPDFEHSFTGSATLYLGVKLWEGGEAYYVPEVVSERPLSQLRGIGGSIQNFELQKGGTPTPQVYRARTYFQQNFDLGGASVTKSSEPLQLGSKVKRRRLVVRAGTFSIIDFLDKNEFAGDLRQQFFNMAFLTYSAYDFNSDARGLTFGGVAELYLDDWAIRFGRVAPPQNPNALSVDFRLDKHFGDQLELEHKHQLLGQPGAVRLLGYRNRAITGRFDDAIAAFQAEPSRANAAACPGYHYDSTNAGAPDLCWSRRPNTKYGIGLNIEQRLTESLGVSFRGMVSDGQSEVYAYTPTDRSVAATLLANGTPWKRPRDLAGVGAAANWISSVHAKYLGMGGVDGFVGDGKIHQASEQVFEVFYSLNLVGPSWVSLDYQHLINPAFNSDRGPVEIFGGRLHAEF